MTGSPAQQPSMGRLACQGSGVGERHPCPGLAVILTFDEDVRFRYDLDGEAMKDTELTLRY